MSKESFRQRLEDLINSESMENGSNTPDFLLAEYLTDCLATYDKAVNARETWYGRGPAPVSEPFGGTANDNDPVNAAADTLAVATKEYGDGFSSTDHHPV